VADLLKWFAMDGHGVYVWSAYLITFVVLLINVLLSGRELRNRLQHAMRAIRRSSDA
jgi:heme exporter protein D